MSVQTRKLIGRSLLLLVALTMIGAMLAACAPAAPAPAAQPTAAPAAAATAAPAPAAEKVQLRFVVMDYDEKMRADTQALVDEFNASQNEIEVKLDVYSWADGYQTLVTQISGGQAPDLANGNAQWVGAWAGINEVAPLDDLLSKEFLANFVPAGLEAFTIDGKLMAMPYFLDPRALYYRKDLFEKAGLKAPETWDDVFAAAQKLNDPPNMNAFGWRSPASRTTWTTGGMRGWAPTARTATPSCGTRTASRASTRRKGSRPPNSWWTWRRSTRRSTPTSRRPAATLICSPCSTTASWPCWRPVPGTRPC